MTEPLVKIVGYSVRLGTNHITLTKDEIWKLFYDLVDILNVPIQEDCESPREIQ